MFLVVSAGLVFLAVIVLTYAGYVAPWSGRFYSLYDTGYVIQYTWLFFAFVVLTRVVALNGLYDTFIVQIPLIVFHNFADQHFVSSDCFLVVATSLQNSYVPSYYA